MRNFSQALQLVRGSGNSLPVPADYLRSVEVALGAELPLDYKLLLQKVGLLVIPGTPAIELHEPAAICAYGASIFNLEGVPPREWPGIPIARIGTHGDDLGLLRSGSRFGPEVLAFDHERVWRGDPRDWTSLVSEDFSSLIVGRHRGLQAS